MSGKSKKTTTDKTVYNDKQTKYISHSATKMTNRLSLSFYAENTLKMNKQVILDTYDDLQPLSPEIKSISKPASLTKCKITKPKTPVLTKFVQQQTPYLLQQTKTIKPAKTLQNTEQKRPVKNSRQRSSSRSSRSKNSTNVLFNYISNRMDGSTKGWNVLRAMQAKNAAHKKL